MYSLRMYVAPIKIWFVEQYRMFDLFGSVSVCISSWSYSNLRFALVDFVFDSEEL